MPRKPDPGQQDGHIVAEHVEDGDQARTGINTMPSFSTTGTMTSSISVFGLLRELLGVIEDDLIEYLVGDVGDQEDDHQAVNRLDHLHVVPGEVQDLQRIDHYSIGDDEDEHRVSEDAEQDVIQVGLGLPGGKVDERVHPEHDHQGDGDPSQKVTRNAP